MKAVQFVEYGGPEVLELVEVDPPHAGPGEIRIAVRAAGVNPLDVKIRSGQMAGGEALAQPSGTGVDAAGVVDELGSGVTDVAVGDEVFGSGSATVADQAVLTSWASKPASVSFAEAAGWPVPAETSMRILAQVGVQLGQTLLVSGASGGVGSTVVQLARHRGITVIGTASPRNQDYLRGLGATATTYGDGLVERVRGLALRGIDAALDIAGSGVIPELIELTGNPTSVLSIADFSAGDWGAQVSSDGVGHAAAFAEVARLAELGEFTLPVEQTFCLADAAQAHVASADGHAAGRLVIIVGS